MSSAAAVQSGGVGVEQGDRGLLPVQEYLPFVKKVAMRMAKRLPSHVAFEDLVSAGVVGLIEAMNRYDPEKVSEFEKYAEFRVKGAILDELRRRDLMARDARLESKNLEAVIDGLTQEYGRSPEEEEIAERLDLSVDELRTKLEKLTPVRVLSFTDVFPASAPSDEPNPFELFAQQELLEHLAKAITKLSERHQLVLQLYYKEDLTLKEIGVVLDVTESRVCQIMSEATHRLRAILQPEYKSKGRVGRGTGK